LELQRGQFEDMKGMVSETNTMTGEVQTLLKKISDRVYRKKVFSYFSAAIISDADARYDLSLSLDFFVVDYLWISDYGYCCVLLVVY
jgi:hypothetical protein